VRYSTPSAARAAWRLEEGSGAAAGWLCRTVASRVKGTGESNSSVAAEKFQAETGRQARGKPEQREERSQGNRERSTSPCRRAKGDEGQSESRQERWRAGECCCRPRNRGQSLNCIGGERGKEPPRSKMKSKDGRKHRRAGEWRREGPNWPLHGDRSRPEGAWSSATIVARGKESAGGLAAVLAVEASDRAARDEEEWPLLRGRSLERGGNESSRAISAAKQLPQAPSRHRSPREAAGHRRPKGLCLDPAKVLKIGFCISWTYKPIHGHISADESSFGSH
jgi:hypothetical protein